MAAKGRQKAEMGGIHHLEVVVEDFSDPKTRLQYPNTTQHAKNHDPALKNHTCTRPPSWRHNAVEGEEGLLRLLFGKEMETAA